MYLSISQASSTRSQYASITTPPKISMPSTEKPNESNFNLDAFLSELQFHTLVEINDENLEPELKDVDAFHLLHALRQVTRELSTLKLENHFITDFLERNDPKLLIGLRARRTTAATTRRSIVLSEGRYTSAGGTATRHSIVTRPSIVTTASIFTTSSAARKTPIDYRLNFRAKTEMADKTAAEAEKRIASLEAKAKYKLKMINTRIEEAKYNLAETQETANVFKLHFLQTQNDLDFLEKASEHHLECKLRKFVNHWIKGGRSLLSKMRLHIKSLQSKRRQYHDYLISKGAISGMLSAVDFEQVVNKRNELLVTLEEQQNHLYGLKAVTVKATQSMSQAKKDTAKIEYESRVFQSQTMDVNSAVEKLRREIKHIENENKNDSKKLTFLQQQVESFEAPSVSEYIERKAELLALEKEEKLLHRKINICNMKLANTLRRCKHHEDVTESSPLQ